MFSNRIPFTAMVLSVVAILPQAMSVHAADLTELVDGDATQVMSDCKFTEGPAWHPDGYLLFTDIPNNRIVRVLPDGTHNDWMTDSQGANGLMCDQQGKVYAAQGNTQQVACMRATDSGEQGELADVLATTFEGQPFNKPNDLALDADGGLYFTDPNYSPNDPPQPVEGVYYLSTEGKVTRVVDDLPRPNGVLVSADGKHLYVANINLRKIMRYDIVGPGSISSGEVIFTGDESLDGGGPDGMSLDEHGNIYATYKSVVVLTGDGDLIGRIEVPEKPANCAFGGPDNQTLYVTARTSLYSIPMKVAGIALRATGPGVTGAGDSETTATREVKAGPLTLNIPESWKQEQPSSRLRLAQFVIPAAEGDPEGTELVLSGPFGGSAQANVQRWINQFDADGRELKMTQGETEQGKYILVDLTGTYNKSVGPPQFGKSKAMPGSRMLAVMLMSKAGNFFFKLAGPEKTVTNAADGLRASFGADAEKESEYTLE
ncbi:MAG: SMP-30/gluconolactonase/LRE family protein [Planctomycetaceae bacterium]|nr:SMP-30/gluconolactonase/LRE family protein [Planctomycetaceae bacterium]